MPPRNLYLSPSSAGDASDADGVVTGPQRFRGAWRQHSRRLHWRLMVAFTFEQIPRRRVILPRISRGDVRVLHFALSGRILCTQLVLLC
jgi:hypothetical protein